MIRRFSAVSFLLLVVCCHPLRLAQAQQEEMWATFGGGYMAPYTYVPEEISSSGEALTFDGSPVFTASIERTLGEGFSLLLSGGFVGFSEQNPDSCLAASDPDCQGETLRVHFFPFALGLKAYLPTNPDGRLHGFFQVSPALFFTDWKQTVNKTTTTLERTSLTTRTGFILGGGAVGRISSKFRAELGVQYWFTGDYDVDRLNGISNQRLRGLRQFATLLGVAYAP